MMHGVEAANEIISLSNVSSRIPQVNKFHLLLFWRLELIQS